MLYMRVIMRISPSAAIIFCSDVGPRFIPRKDMLAAVYAMGYEGVGSGVASDVAR